MHNILVYIKKHADILHLNALGDYRQHDTPSWSNLIAWHAKNILILTVYCAVIVLLCTLFFTYYKAILSACMLVITIDILRIALLCIQHYYAEKDQQQSLAIHIHDIYTSYLQSEYDIYATLEKYRDAGKKRGYFDNTDGTGLLHTIIHNITSVMLVMWRRVRALFTPSLASIIHHNTVSDTSPHKDLYATLQTLHNTTYPNAKRADAWKELRAYLNTLVNTTKNNQEEINNTSNNSLSHLSSREIFSYDNAHTPGDTRSAHNNPDTKNNAITSNNSDEDNGLDDADFTSVSSEENNCNIRDNMDALSPDARPSNFLDTLKRTLFTDSQQ